jgi:hypothetical protein
VSAKEKIKAHTDHPARHWDRTCPACAAEEEQIEPLRPVKSFTGGIPRYAMDAPVESKLKEKNT